MRATRLASQQASRAHVSNASDRIPTGLRQPPRQLATHAVERSATALLEAVIGHFRRGKPLGLLSEGLGTCEHAHHVLAAGPTGDDLAELPCETLHELRRIQMRRGHAGVVAFVERHFAGAELPLRALSGD